MYACGTMRAKSGYEPFGGSVVSQGSSGGSGDSVNATLKPQMNQGYSSTHSQASSGTPNLRSQPGSFQPYQPYHEDEVPFDQQRTYVIDSAVPSFDEGTDDPVPYDNEDIPSYEIAQPEFHILGNDELYEEDYDDRIVLDDAPRHRQALHLSESLDNSIEDSSFHLADDSPNVSLLATQGVVYPDRELYSGRESEWQRVDQGGYHNGSSYPQQQQQHGVSSRVQPPMDYTHTSSYEDHLATREIPAPKIKPRSILKRRHYHGESDADDSALLSSDDSADARGRRSKGVDRNGRTTRLDAGGHTSDEGDSSDSTRRRTKVAFDKRGKSRSKAPGESRGVSFDKRHRVHRYEQELEEDEETNFSGYTGASSVNSTYSKSMESEVEDLVRDLFFLGESRTARPGRRRLSDRNRHEYDETTLEDSATLETYDEDSTLNTHDDEFNTYDESTYGGTLETRTMTIPSSDVSNEDPLTSMWNMMQGGVSAMGAVLGVTVEPDDDEEEEDERQKETVNKPPTEIDKEAVMTSLDTTVTDDELDNSRSSTLAEMFQMASGLFMGTPTEPETKEKEPDTSLEGDGRLAELALHAAQSKHEAFGYVYDESHEVDIVTEIQFSVVNVLLPMGILFQENAGGCWVTKVFASGNAAQRATGGTVEVGDQLAAIDGTSAVELKVDKICSMVSQVPKGDYVELTFLRYTGPMRPKGRLDEDEGYEVHDPAVKRKSKGKEIVWIKSKRKVRVDPPVRHVPPPKEKKKRFRLFGRGKKRSI